MMELGDSIKARKKSKKMVHGLKPYQKKGIIKAITHALRDNGIPSSEQCRVFEILSQCADSNEFLPKVRSIIRKYEIEGRVTLPELKRKSRTDYSEEYQEWFFSNALYIDGRFHWIPKNRRLFMIAVAEVLLNPSLSNEQALALVDNAVQDHLL